MKRDTDLSTKEEVRARIIERAEMFYLLGDPPTLERFIHRFANLEYYQDMTPKLKKYRAHWFFTSEFSRGHAYSGAQISGVTKDKKWIRINFSGEVRPYDGLLIKITSVATVPIEKLPFLPNLSTKRFLQTLSVVLIEELEKKPRKFKTQIALLDKCTDG